MCTAWFNFLTVALISRPLTAGVCSAAGVGTRGTERHQLAPAIPAPVGWSTAKGQGYGKEHMHFMFIVSIAMGVGRSTQIQREL